jgi:hypothetical protein
MRSTDTMAWEILDRMEQAVARMRERLLRVKAVLNQPGIAYAVVDGDAGPRGWSNRDKDRTHIRDLVGVGLIDRSWLSKLPPALAERFQGILDTPDA